MNIEIRTGTPEDTDRVSDILINSRKTFINYARLAHTDDEVREWVTNSLIPAGGVAVAELNRVVIAVLATSNENGTNWIDQMYIDPLYVGKGIGTKMLRDLLQTTSKPIRLYTFQQNTGARRFYERHGFQAIQFTDGMHNEEQCPDVLYELSAKN